MTISSAQSILPLDKSSVRSFDEARLPDFVKYPDPDIYLGDNYLVIDFECTNLDKGSAVNGGNGLVLAVCSLGPDHPRWAGVEQKFRVFFGSEYEQQELLDLIGDANFVVAHNAKFELQWLRRCGQDLRRVLPYCTQIGDYVRGGNRKWRLGLSHVASRFSLGNKLETVSALIHGGICPSEIPKELLEEYCRKDVELTEDIFLKQRTILKKEGLLPVFYCRNLLTPVLADIEFEGMQLDDKRVKEAFGRIQSEFLDAKRQLDDYTGGINQNSPKQVREFLYDRLGFKPPTDAKGNPIRTSSGELSVGKEVIGLLRAETPEQRGFIGLYKRISPLKKKIQILTKLKECCEEDNGHLYAVFNQTVTQTHRLSSSGRRYGIQFQNFPRAFKPLFHAGNPECVLVEGDAPQLEFRVACDLGDDRNGITGICQGVDVHKLTSEVMGIERTPAKAFTFKPLYGGNSGASKERAYYEAFRREYSGVYNTQRGWVYKVLADRSLRIPSGLIFYWPDTKIQQSGYVTNTPSIFNYPVQSFATADIVPLSLVSVWHRLGGGETTDATKRIRLVNTVHDSIVAEVHKDVLQYYKEVLIKAFTEDIYVLIERLYGRKLKVPLGVGIKADEHWGEGEEEKYDALDKIKAYLESKEDAPISGNLGLVSGRTGDGSEQAVSA